MFEGNPCMTFVLRKLCFGSIFANQWPFSKILLRYALLFLICFKMFNLTLFRCYVLARIVARRSFSCSLFLLGGSWGRSLGRTRNTSRSTISGNSAGSAPRRDQARSEMQSLYLVLGRTLGHFTVGADCRPKDHQSKKASCRNRKRSKVAKWSTSWKGPVTGNMQPGNSHSSQENVKGIFNLKHLLTSKVT